jgi:hypothetical protein
MGAKFGQLVLFETWHRGEYFGLIKEEEEEIDITMYEIT